MGANAFADNAHNNIITCILSEIDFTIYDDANIDSSVIYLNQYIKKITIYPSQLGKYFAVGNILTDKDNLTIDNRIENIVIVGADSAEAAQANELYTLSRRFISDKDHSNFGWWTSQADLNFVIKGFVNASSEVDGSKLLTHYRLGVRLYFDSMAAFDYYVASVVASGLADDTFGNYAALDIGMIAICGGDGVPGIYNVTYVDGVVGLKAYTAPTSADAQIRLPVVNDKPEGYCTPVVMCMCCDAVVSDGIKHVLVVGIVYENYLAEGKKLTSCTNEGCDYESYVSVPALFIDLGYSTTELGNFGIVQGFTVNLEALDAYMAENPEFVFGIVASTVESPLDNEGNVIDASKTIVANMTGTRNVMIEIKVINIGTNVDKPIICCGYVVDGGEVYYLDNGETTKTPLFTSYNER